MVARPDHAEHAGTKENGLATQSRSFFWRQTVLIKARLQSPNDLSLSILIRMNLDVIAANLQPDAKHLLTKGRQLFFRRFDSYPQNVTQLTKGLASRRCTRFGFRAPDIIYIMQCENEEQASSQSISASVEMPY